MSPVPDSPAPGAATSGPPAPDVTAAAVHDAADRIAGLLRAASGPGVRIPRSEWTVGEAAAHLALANRLMAGLAAGEAHGTYGDGTPGGLAAANTASLAAYPERDLDVLAEEIATSARAFTTAAAARPASAPAETPMGPMDLATFGSYLLTHILGHGYDIAVALRRPHMLTPANAALTVPFLRTAMPRVVNPRTASGHTACYRLRLRGAAAPPFAVTFTSGTVEVTDEPPRRPDVTITAEPVTFVLLALGRRTPVAAAARGGIVPTGRRPWLAPRFPGLFTAP
ncbi:maleylpyruvate isomerase family mycothiol-dependent enzyme [Streptomyces sp. NPDC020983]|uniref:maleylpyruvate isomerase family mycothiol-dependent enzyme n=1 Tax=Streptomyces sp. NPDC020983 TaxID=3365106 RepID=UPI00378D0273